jgi:hypothetical protein
MGYLNNVQAQKKYNIIKLSTFFPKNILKTFLHGFSSNQHIVQKPVSEMYTSHFEHVWSSTFQQQQKPTDLHHITKYFYKNFSFFHVWLYLSVYVYCIQLWLYFFGHVYCIHFGFVFYTSHTRFY